MIDKQMTSDRAEHRRIGMVPQVSARSNSPKLSGRGNSAKLSGLGNSPRLSGLTLQNNWQLAIGNWQLPVQIFISIFQLRLVNCSALISTSRNLRMISMFVVVCRESGTVVNDPPPANAIGNNN